MEVPSTLSTNFWILSVVLVGEAASRPLKINCS